MARRCHLPPFPLPPHRTASSASCSISPSKSVPSDSLKSALDRVPLHSPRRLPSSLLLLLIFPAYLHLSSQAPATILVTPGRSGIHLHPATFSTSFVSKPDSTSFAAQPKQVEKKESYFLTASRLRSTNSPASTAAPRVQSSPAQPSRAQPKPSLSSRDQPCLPWPSLCPQPSTSHSPCW